MYAIVGLGNPGADYSVTRHNAGFILADALADSWNLDMRLVGTRAQAASGSARGIQVVVVKPLTYMNRSGAIVRELLRTEDIDITKLLVLVDDFALPFGTFRIRPSGSDGGHNGLASIDQALGRSDYARLRIGVGPVPEDVAGADYVLGEMTSEQIEKLRDLIPTMTDAVNILLKDGVETAMNRFNRRITESE